MCQLQIVATAGYLQRCGMFSTNMVAVAVAQYQKVQWTSKHSFAGLSA